MTAVKRALIVTSLQRYIVLAINFTSLAVLSRLLTPAEIGVSIIGIGLVTICQTLRDFGLVAYVINQIDGIEAKARSAFTVSIAIALALAAALAALSAPIAEFYGDKAFKAYMLVAAVQLIAGTFYGPIAALLQRDMNFSSLAVVEIAATACGALVTIALAMSGTGALSVAWGGLVQSAVAGLLPLCFLPAFWVFRPSLAHWRDVVSFGAFTSLGFVLSRAYDLITASLYGRLLSLTALGLYNRSMMVCDLPMKGLLSGVVPIALPALAAEKREGRCIKSGLLNGFSLLTAVLWPALAVLALFAGPVVAIVLGDQWSSASSFVPVIAASAAFSFPAFFTYPVLVLAGHVRQTVTCQAVSLPLCVLIVFVAAHYGLEAVVWSLLLTVPLQNATALYFIRRAVPFGWSELAAALRSSALLTVATALPAATAMVTLHALGASSLLAFPLGVAAAAAGWLAGLMILDHPLSPHIRDAIGLVRKTVLQLRPAFNLPADDRKSG